MIENEAANRITNVSRSSPRNNSETITNEHDKEIPKERLLMIWNWYNSIIMGHRKITNLLDNTPNQPTIIKTKYWAEINDESRGTYIEDNKIRFKTSMLRSSLCDYSDAYILVKGTITIENKVAWDQPTNAAKKKVIFKNYAPSTNWISRINGTQVDDAHDLDVVMSKCNLIEYSDNYSKTSGILWEYCWDQPALNNGGIFYFTADNTITDSSNIEVKVTGNDGTKNVKIMVPLRYLSNFWRTLLKCFWLAVKLVLI